MGLGEASVISRNLSGRETVSQILQHHHILQNVDDGQGHEIPGHPGACSDKSTIPYPRLFAGHNAGVHSHTRNRHSPALRPMEDMRGGGGQCGYTGFWKYV